jgi:glycosyltransferase involved in cell wall biosynthesis
MLIATDAFPPNCGGSGWSTWELARGLRARGHTLAIIQPRPGAAGHHVREYDGFTIDEFAAWAPAVPVLRTYFKNERLTPALADHLERIIRRDQIDLVHAQHVLTTPAAIAAAHTCGIPAVATVRDYWPVCYWATLLVDPEASDLCPACSAAGMQRCLRPRAGLGAPIAYAAIPYMRRNLATKRSALAQADAIVAVSTTIAQDLRARAPELAATRIEQIPNPFDLSAIRTVATAQRRPLAGPYAVYVGKLETNKGADLLPRIARLAALEMPLVAVGDGALRATIERDAARSAVDIRCTGWLSREAVLGWLRSATLLVFPSRGPESLSRVLVEAAALGVPVAAIDTGGTRDIVHHGVTGLLSSDEDGCARDVARLVSDSELAGRLGAAARAHADAQFDATAVVNRVERLYGELVGQRAQDRVNG